MRLTVRLDERHARRWHLLLLQRLAAVPGLVLDVDPRAGQGAMPAGADLLFRFEALIFGLPGDGPAAPLPRAALAPFVRAGSEPADLTLDLGGDPPSGGGRRWRLTFDGLPGDAGLLDALLEGRTPTAAIVEGDAVVAAGRLGTEYGGVALAAFEDMLARSTTLILAAVAGAAKTGLPDLPDDRSRHPRPPARIGAAALARMAARRLARRIVQRLYYLAYHAPHWRTGWRRLEGPDLFDLRAHPETGWRELPDDGGRFYADPFPLMHGGQLTLFVEDFAHRLGKGIISAVAFGPDGPIGRPQPVLEQPGHLSYPFVFERDGAVWMIPESGGAGTVDLFRATAFPGGWVKEATLLAGLTASDATLVEHDGLWWMFATVRDGGGAFSDALHLWSAPDFRGPWTPHPHNPVLIDIASARPAGRMVRRGGALLRPVQDCRRGYGAALGIARVTRLDAGGFAQEVETILTPGPLWPGRRLHTLNSAGGLEFIDGSGLAPRWGRRAG